MAIGPTAKWNMQTDGSNTNGGFYTSGGTDYSQQASAQLALTDIASDGAGTGISSATGGFTAAMVGNGIYITGGDGFTTGWYEITAYTDTNNITIDRSAGANKSGGTGNVGGAVALPTDALLESCVPGNTWYIKTGTYVLTGNVNITKDGAKNNFIKFIGYNSTHGDNPAGTNRPLISGTTYQFRFSSALYWRLKNIRYTGTTSAMFIGQYNVLSNSKIDVSNAAYALYVLQYSSTYDCEIIGTNAIGVNIATSPAHVSHNNIHDCGTRGISAGGGTITGNIFDTCDIGVYAAGVNGNIIKKNIFYNCSSYGVQFDINYTAQVFNNDFNTCGVGAFCASSGFDDQFILDNNNFYDNTTDVTDVTKGDNATAEDPSYTDAPNGDFSNSLTQGNALFPPGSTANYVSIGPFQQEADDGSVPRLGVAYYV